MFQRNPNRSIFIIILVARLCYAFWSWIKPSLILPSHAINYTKKYILIISKALIIISSILLPLHLQFTRTRHERVPTPAILVIDQSRSMSHNDLTPSRRSVVQYITDSLIQIGILPDKGGGRRPEGLLVTYAQVPTIHSSLSALNSLTPLSSSKWSSALGDARLIAYDQIWSWLNYKPIVITMTDGGSNTWYNLSQTAQILKTRAQLRIVWLSTGTQIVAYDDSWRWLTSTMDASLLSSLAGSWHRYPVPDDASVDWVINTLWQNLRAEYYQLWPITFNLWPILWILLWLWILWRFWIYLNRKAK